MMIVGKVDDKPSSRFLNVLINIGSIFTTTSIHYLPKGCVGHPLTDAVKNSTISSNLGRSRWANK